MRKAIIIFWAALALAFPGGSQTGKGDPTPPPSSYDAFFGQQHAVVAGSERWQVRLESWQPLEWPPDQFTFDIQDQATGTHTRLTLHSWGSPSESLRVSQVDELAIFDGKLLILGRAVAGMSEAIVVQLPGGKILDQFTCFEPAVSPDHKFLAFMKSFPLHPGNVLVTAEYLAYTLAEGSAENRPHVATGVSYEAGLPVYPEGAKNAPGENLLPDLDSPAHWISSARLIWLDAKTLAFADHFSGETKLVVVDLSRGIRAARVGTELLDPSELIDVQRCRSTYSADDWKRRTGDPSGLIRVAGILPAPEGPGYISLQFSAEPCLTRTKLTLKLP